MSEAKGAECMKLCKNNLYIAGNEKMEGCRLQIKGTILLKYNIIF